MNIDEVNDEVYLPVVQNRILGFDLAANGDVSLKRMLTGISGSVQVDAVHNLLMVSTGRDAEHFRAER